MLLCHMWRLTGRAIYLKWVISIIYMEAYLHSISWKISHASCLSLFSVKQKHFPPFRKIFQTMTNKPKKWPRCYFILNFITTFLSWPTRVLASRDRPLNVLFIIADDLGKTSDLDFLNSFSTNFKSKVDKLPCYRILP